MYTWISLHVDCYPKISATYFWIWRLVFSGKKATKCPSWIGCKLVCRSSYLSIRYSRHPSSYFCFGWLNQKYKIGGDDLASYFYPRCAHFLEAFGKSFVDRQVVWILWSSPMFCVRSIELVVPNCFCVWLISKFRLSGIVHMAFIAASSPSVEFCVLYSCWSHLTGSNALPFCPIE